MKYNKRELQAIDALLKIATALKTQEPVELASAEETALLTVLGIDLNQITKRKKDVKAFIRNKRDALLSVRPAMSPHRYPSRYCFFRFQIGGK